MLQPNNVMIGFLCLVMIISCANFAHADTIIVDSGESIQKVIEKAASGDIIEVKEGIYRENLEVNKKLTLRGIDDPQLQAVSEGSTINVSADGCLIEGFEVSNSSGWLQAGIRVTSDNNIIRKNVVKDNEIGIFLNESNGNVLTNLDARTGGTGILLMRSSNNTIKDSFASCNGKYSSSDIAGIWLLGSCNNNLISGNDLFMSGPIKSGILLTESSGNWIIGNNATGSGWISGFGIGLLESHHNEIKNNTVQSNGVFGQGIRLMSSRGNTISDNEASCYGPMAQSIAILQSSYNTISGNRAQSWLWGRDMAFEGSWGNRLSGNHAERIRGHHVQAIPIPASGRHRPPGAGGFSVGLRPTV